MRPIRTHFLMAGLLLFLHLQVSGQALITTFTPATVTAAVGDTVSVQLQVTNFTNITSLQLPITYNASLLQFVTITNATLPGFAASNYNATSGKVTVSWYPDLAQYPNGYTAPAGSAIFTMRFIVAALGNSAVNIANVSPGIEVTRNNIEISVTFGSGGTTITGTGNPATTFQVQANTIHIAKGQTGCMPVTVKNFNNLVSMSYVMHWDTSVLQYQNTKNYNLPDLAASSFNVLPANSGNLLMSWFEQALTGITRPNGTTIYEVCFLAKGNAGSTSMVTIDGVGFPPGGGPAEAITLSSTDVWTPGSGVADTIFVIAPPPPANAVTFTADKDTVVVNGMTCVDVRVKNFNDIISTQFGITYNPAIIQFKSPIQFGSNPLGLSAANFNTSIPGEIKFTWFDQNALGVDLPDSTIIFSICFNAIGAGGTQSPFNFVSLPGLPVEVVKEPGGEVTPLLNNGHVYITACVPPVIQATPTPVLCNGTATGSISTKLIQGGPAMNYTFSGPGISGGSMTTMDTFVVNLTPGTYTVTVTVASGCATATATAVVTAPAAVSSAISVNNVTCFGGSNGAINQIPAGGTAPYTYKWAGNPALPGNGMPATQNLSGLVAGTYTVTITDSKGCTFVSVPAISVGQATQPSFAPSLTVINRVNCFGQSTGSVSLPNPSGGTAPHTFAWSNGAVTKNITNVAAATYTLTVTDANMCTRTFQYTVPGPTAALAISQTGGATPATCFGSNNGAASVNVSGGTPFSGTPAYTISWRKDSLAGQVISTGLNPTNLVPGVYYPSVTDSLGCTASIANPITILGPTSAITTNPTTSNVKCSGNNDGSITLAPAGGNGGPFTVLWSNNQSGLTINNLPPGAYIPTVSDAQGCTTTTAAINITAPQPIAIGDTTIVPQDGMTLGSITLEQITGGTPPLTYKWAGPNGYMSTNQNITGVGFGIYTVTITDANNCTMTATYEVPSTNLLILTTASPVMASCNDDGCITFNIPMGAIPPFLIDLKRSGDPTSKQYPTTLNTFQVCNLTSGIYEATISDASGNSFTISPLIQVAQLQQAIVSDSRVEPFDDFKNGSIKLNPVPASANLTYEWNYNGLTSSTISNLDSGTYVVTVTNLTSGCTAVYTFELNRTYQPFQCSLVQVTPTTCANASAGAISISVSGADGPTYTYAWAGPNGYTSTNQNITGLLPGTYTCTVFDESQVAHTCPVATVTSQSQLAVTNVNILSDYNGFEVSGSTVCDGSASVVFSGQVGNVSVAWSNGVSGASNTSLCGGNYTVTVTDQLGCTSTWTGSLTFPPSVVGSAVISTNFNGYGVSCDGHCDGSASVSAVGGVPPYRIAWPTGQVDQQVLLGGFSQANQLCGGEYKVTITDKNNVVTVYTFTITEPDPLVFEYSSVPPVSFSLCDGEVIADVPAGVGDLTLTWSTNLGKNGTGPRAEDLCPGERVTFIVVDENGCTGVGNFQMEYPVDGCLQVRPVITPGSLDGKNDYALITCIEDYPDNVFEIYNRWGQLVEIIRGYNNGSSRWEGFKDGQLLPDGAYYFVLKYTDKDGIGQVLKGNINLIR